MVAARRRGWVWVWLLLAAGLVVGAQYAGGSALLRGALGAIGRLGPAGAGLFVLVYVLATVLFVPGWVLTVGAGVLFGVFRGAVLVSIASTLGATAAFLVARYLARDWVAAKIAGNPTFEAIDEAVADEGWKIVGLARLSPLFPFNLLNYALGLTRIGLRPFVLASWIGMMPATVLYVYLGSLAGDLARLGAGDRGRTPLEWAFVGVGLLATIVVTAYVTRRARATLGRRMAGREVGAHGQPPT